MGAEPYLYYTKYQDDVDAALQELRQTEFEAGRYFPVMMFPETPIGPDSPKPGAQHDSIEDALEAAEEQGTCSILDLERLCDTPDYGAAAPLSAETIKKLYKVDQPTREMIEENMDFLETLGRGQGYYTIVYKDGQPNEIMFAGMTFD